MQRSKNLLDSYIVKSSFYSKLIYLALFVLFLISVLYILKPLTHEYYPDFSCYYYGAKTYMSGGNPYTDEGGSFGAFVYPPPSLLLFIPFTIFPFNVAQKLFTIISLSSLLLSLHLLISAIKLKPFSKGWLLLYTLALNFFPAKYTLGMGQINNIILLLLVAFISFYLRKRNTVSGILLAVATIIKITPMFLLLFLIIKRKWKIILTCVASIVVVFVPTLYLVKPSLVIYYFQNTLPSQLNSWPKDYYNQSITGFLARHLVNIQIRNILKNIISLLIAAYSVFVSVKSSGSKEKDILSIGIFITLSLILNGISWQHHFVWLLMPLFLTLNYMRKIKVDNNYYFFLFVCYILTALNIKNPSTYPLFLQSHVFYGALTLLLLQLHLILKKG